MPSCRRGRRYKRCRLLCWRALQQELPATTFDTRLKETEGLRCPGAVLVVRVPSADTVAWLEQRMYYKHDSAGPAGLLWSSVGREVRGFRGDCRSGARALRAGWLSLSAFQLSLQDCSCCSAVSVSTAGWFCQLPRFVVSDSP